MRIHSHPIIRRSDVFRQDFSGKAKSIARRPSEQLTEIHFDDKEKGRTVVVDIPDSLMPKLIKAYEKGTEDNTTIPRFLKTWKKDNQCRSSSSSSRDGCSNVRQAYPFDGPYDP